MEKDKNRIFPNPSLVLGDKHRYVLKSIVQHHSSTVSQGHYTTLVSTNEQQTMLRCNDDLPLEEVKIDSSKRKLEDDYIYFYEKVPRPASQCKQSVTEIVESFNPRSNGSVKRKADNNLSSQGKNPKQLSKCLTQQCPEWCPCKSSEDLGEDNLEYKLNKGHCLSDTLVLEEIKISDDVQHNGDKGSEQKEKYRCKNEGLTQQCSEGCPCKCCDNLREDGFENVPCQNFCPSETLILEDISGNNEREQSAVETLPQTPNKEKKYRRRKSNKKRLSGQGLQHEKRPNNDEKKIENQKGCITMPSFSEREDSVLTEISHDMQHKLKVNREVIVGKKIIRRRQGKQLNVRCRQKDIKANANIRVKTSRIGDLTVAHINVRGMTDDTVSEINIILEDKGFDVVCFTEHHRKDPSYEPGGNIKVEHYKKLEFEGYESLIKYRITNTGGVAMFWKKHLNFTEWSHSQKDDNFDLVKSEYAWVKMKHNDETIAIGTVYMGVHKSNDSNGTWNDTIYEALGKDIDELEKLQANINIKGDFNGHISNGKDGIKGNHPQKNKNGERLLKFCCRKKLTILNCKRKTRGGKEYNFCKGLWTWQRGEHKSIINYSLVNQ